MKSHYALLIVSIMSIGQAYAYKSDKSGNGKSAHAELHMLLEKKNPNNLTLNEVRKVRSLIRDLEKTDKKAADHIKMQYIEIQYGCCDSLSEFRKRDTVLELKDAFNNPQPK